MFDFTMEWTTLRSPIDRAFSAKEMIDQFNVRETWIAPLILLTTFLFALGIITGAHLRERDDQASRHAAFAGVSMGMPLLFPSRTTCRGQSSRGSAPQLRHADVLALLASD